MTYEATVLEYYPSHYYELGKGTVVTLTQTATYTEVY